MLQDSIDQTQKKFGGLVRAVKPDKKRILVGLVPISGIVWRLLHAAAAGFEFDLISDARAWIPI